MKSENNKKPSVEKQFNDIIDKIKNKNKYKSKKSEHSKGCCGNCKYVFEVELNKKKVSYCKINPSILWLCELDGECDGWKDKNK